MSSHTRTSHQRRLLRRTLATLRAVESWFWQRDEDPHTPFPAAGPPDAHLLAVFLQLEVVRLEMGVLAAGVNKERGGGTIWPHTSACRARPAETSEAVQIA
jgi:hypothetical protein